MRVFLHFHPDWPFRTGLAIEGMARDKRYYSQFVTGTSNGGLTAHPGGDRWEWESRLFGGRYDSDLASRRPVYGALGDGQSAYGPAIRFGSAHFRLRTSTLDRVSLCFPDSVFQPDSVHDASEGRSLLASAASSDLDDLDRYVEAHVHGGASIPDDVEALVLDPSHRGTPVEDVAKTLQCPIEWHNGFVLHTQELDPDYRGADVVDLAQSLGEELSPRILGEVARSGAHDPQLVKRVWHYMAKFGRVNAEVRDVGPKAP